jgi:hypothetical protein
MRVIIIAPNKSYLEIDYQNTNAQHITQPKKETPNPNNDSDYIPPPRTPTNPTTPRKEKQLNKRIKNPPKSPTLKTPF